MAVSYKISTPLFADAENLYHRGFRGDASLAVLIKIPLAAHPDARALARLRHEHSILKELSLAGIPTVHSLERHLESSLALVLEDIPGQPLSLLLAQQRMELTNALHIASGVAGILGAIHKLRVIHQGIRPHNIFVDATRQVVHLIDFSSASRLGAEAARPIALVIQAGSIEYISPEQTGRMNRLVDSRSDLYSLGIVLYEMLSGAAPFHSPDPMEVVHSHLARKPIPLHLADPSIPIVVSELVQRLLAKAPEERYQTARGLKADLDECLRQLKSGGELQPFPFGRSDCDGQLRPVQRLYGREAQLQTLMSAFERVSHGACELLMVAGYSGIGKSVLVHEINKPISIRGGHFISGKFDQYNRNIPYDSLGQAFRELIRSLLGEKEEKLAAWRTRIQAAIAPNGSLLTALIPELELVIGPQPAVSALGPTETQNRFRLVLQSFVRALATPEHPLVVFLDDLQWIDSASLKVLEGILTDPERTHLLVIGAYRDNEVDSAHLLALTLDVLRKSSATLHEIKLEPLDPDSVAAMLSDMLGHFAQHVAPLAKVLHAKTHGNPFFVSQLVSSLHSDRLLSFDEALGRWEWDLDAISGRMVTDNVVTLLIGKLRQLPPQTQLVLRYAAAIGHRFDLKALSTIVEMSTEETGVHLWPALHAGLLWPLNVDYRFLYPGEKNVPEILSSAEFHVAFKFLHDRVQQAAYALIPDTERQQLHLRIGRLMLQSRAEGASEQDESLFEIAKHLNIGMALITDERERLELARLNLTVGRRAKAASAPEAAAAYLATGMSLLAKDPWEHQYELWFDLASECAESESLNGRFKQVDSLLDQLMERCKSDLEYGRVSGLRMVAYGMQGNHFEALACGNKALARLGIVIPEAPEQLAAAFGAELAEAERILGQRRIADLVHAPAISDPAISTAIKLLNLMAATAYLVAPGAYGVIIVKQANISLKHGNVDTSAYGYASYGFILACLLGQYSKGHEFCQLALALNDKFHNSSLSAQLHVVSGLCLHFMAPLRRAIESFGQAYRAGLEVGDFLWLSYACFSISLFKLSMGDELQEVASELSWFLQIADRTKDVTAAPQLLLCRQIVENLQGRTNGRFSLSSDGFDEEQFRADLEASRVAPTICRYYLAKLQLLYLYQDSAGALAAATKIETLIESLTGLYERSIYVFYTSLILLAQSQSAPAEERERHAKALALCHSQLAAWATQCPANYAHKLAIFRAEAAALAGSPDAGQLYQEAVAAAGSSDFPREAALANELAARYFLKQGHTAQARKQMQAARRAYAAWGATAKVAHLDETYPELRHLSLDESPPKAPALAAADGPGPVATPSNTDIPLDLLTVLRVAQTLASQIVLDDVLEQILRAVIANSGAQRGCLVLERNGQLILEALLAADGAAQTRLGIPLESSTEVPTSIIQYVARTQETVVLGDASGRNRFVGDRYIAANQPKSLLCLALLHQGRLVGILYLENNLANNVFTENRVELLRLLSSHAAVSVQNALLYSQVKAVTQQLDASNKELSKTNVLLQAELVERARAEKERQRAEEERARLREEIIRGQQVRLAELSTPLIPIHDKIMVMPIIGTVDEQRAQQVVEAALNGAQAHRTETVIIDITGVQHIDTNIAKTLIQAATALRLLGTHAVLTGIRAEVAQTLVRLGIDLGGIVTLGTLQSGIAYALKRTGQSALYHGGGTSTDAKKRKTSD